jgi:hypothetical protein
MMKLETIVLQQREEGARQEHEPGQHIGGEENDLTTLQIGEPS